VGCGWVDGVVEFNPQEENADSSAQLGRGSWKMRSVGGGVDGGGGVGVLNAALGMGVSAADCWDVGWDDGAE
tara:strand:- start:779 stop:994 length:216 start_codon:yes stop_codon:yes gene_type:complete